MQQGRPAKRRRGDMNKYWSDTIWQRRRDDLDKYWMERHDLAEDSARQANLETAFGGLRPTTGHYGCLVMMMITDSHQYFLA